MAVLLAFLVSSDGDATEGAWCAMRARARARACEAGVERRGPGWRAWAARSIPSEPEPFVEIGGDGREPAAVLLLDRAIGDHDPSDRRRGDWSSRRLFDGTACAAIRIDGAGRRVELTRDLLGQRSLVWADLASGFVVASGEDILRAHPGVRGDLDLDWFAALIAGIAPDDEASAYRSIRVLPSGAELSVSDGRRSTVRQTLTPDAGAARATDAEVLERFRGLVDRAVGRSLRGVSRPAISLSGGLDSALVAESVARQWHGTRPLAVAFGFDRWPEIDERQYARAVAERLGFEFVSYAADELRPMRPGLERPVCPDTPYATPYREIKEVGYRIASSAGCDAMLSGNFGDHLYAHPARWLVDALQLGRFDVVRSSWRAGGLRGIRLDPGFRILARPWRLRSSRPPAGLAMLAASPRERLERAWRARLGAHRGWRRPTQALLCLDALAAFDSYGEDWFAARHRLSFRQPLRDPELTRFMLSLPAFDSTRGRVSKWPARALLRGCLPEAIVDRPKGGDLTPFAEAADRSERPALLARSAEVRPLVEPLLSDAGRRQLDQGDLTWLLATVASWLEGVDRRQDGHDPGRDG